MNFDLNGKRAFICGGSQGIGRAIAIELAGMGAEIILLARNEEDLKKLAASLSGNKKHGYIVCDFDKPEDLKKKAENFVIQNGPVHILVNNSGGPPSGPIINAKTEEFEIAFKRHLICNQILAQVLIDGMKNSGYG